MHTLSGKIISQYLDTTNCSEILSRNEIVKNWAWEKKKLVYNISLFYEMLFDNQERQVFTFY